MIIVNLKGGIGNQLFQYACGRALSLRNNDKLYFDNWVLDSNIGTKRNYELDAFGIKEDIANIKDINKIKYGGNLRKILRLVLHYPKTYIEEKNSSFNPEVIGLKGDVYLDGYWFSYKYFNDYEKYLKKEIKLKKGITSDLGKQLLKKIENSSNSVSLHVRRGDYVNIKSNFDRYEQCGIKYYSDGLEFVQNRIGEKIKVFVFSEDKEWIKKNIKGSNVVYVEKDCDKTDAEDLILMSKCKHNIIANSSYSWWAAWLNQNRHKTVVVPKTWYKNEHENKIIHEDLIPKEWIRL